MIHISKSSHKIIFEGTHIAIYILQLFKLGNNLQKGYYCRSGNFRAKKLSYDKFSCKKNFIGTTLTMLALIVRTNFRKINFRSRHRLQKYFYNKYFQIYGILLAIEYNTFRKSKKGSRHKFKASACDS